MGNTELAGVMRYKNLTPNPLPASEEGAMITNYLIKLFVGLFLMLTGLVRSKVKH